jgi:hypothetical protein
MGAEQAKSAVFTANALLSFEHVEQLRLDQGMPMSRIISSLVTSLSTVFATSSQ